MRQAEENIQGNGDEQQHDHHISRIDRRLIAEPSHYRKYHQQCHGGYSAIDLRIGKQGLEIHTEQHAKQRYHSRHQQCGK